MTREIDVDSHKIMQMEPEKRDRVINAALTVFRHGYGHTSTDDIVREAGISKGLLYHYFGTKEGLYEFLLSYALDVMAKEYFDLLNTGQRDVLELMRQSLLLKMDLSYRYPALFEFMGAAYAENRDDSRLSRVFDALRTDMADRLFASTDISFFKEGIDPLKAVNIIRWTLFGYSDSHISKDKSISDYQDEYGKHLTEIEAYFALFRKIFYKGEQS
jgi:AcrR family transcriptional regulator